MIKPLEILREYYKPGSRAYEILVRHSEQVAEKALRAAEKVQSLNPDLDFILEASMLHDIGIYLTDDCSIEEIGFRKGEYKLPDVTVRMNKDLPKVTLLGTGGTVASRLDYRTGAVLPAFTPQELFSAVPELMDICQLTPKKIYGILSENFKPEFWVKTAQAVMKEFDNGADGVIIGH